MENYTQENKYLEAKKRVKQEKGFYVHLLINIVSILIIVPINLVFSPSFHWFWFAVGGIIIVTFIHWMLVFGQDKLGFGKDWEQRKINEYLKENK